MNINACLGYTGKDGNKQSLNKHAEGEGAKEGQRIPGVNLI